MISVMSGRAAVIPTTTIPAMTEFSVMEVIAAIMEPALFTQETPVHQIRTSLIAVKIMIDVNAGKLQSARMVSSAMVLIPVLAISVSTQETPVNQAKLALKKMMNVLCNGQEFTKEVMTIIPNSSSRPRMVDILSQVIPNRLALAVKISGY